MADVSATPPDHLRLRCPRYIQQGLGPQDPARVTKTSNYVDLMSGWFFPMKDCNVPDHVIPPATVPFSLRDFTVTGLRYTDRYPEDVAFGIRITRPVNPSSSAYFSGLIFPDCPYPHILPDKNHLVAVPQQPDLIPGPDLQPFQLRVFPRPAAERIQNSHVFPVCKNHETLLCVP